MVFAVVLFLEIAARCCFYRLPIATGFADGPGWPLDQFHWSHLLPPTIKHRGGARLMQVKIPITKKGNHRHLLVSGSCILG